MTYLDIARGLKSPVSGTMDPFRAYRAAPTPDTPLVDGSPPPPPTCAESAISAVSPRPQVHSSDYAPLDDVIAADMAARYPHSEIVARADRLARRAAAPGAPALDRVLADDWQRILVFADTFRARVAS